MGALTDTHSHCFRRPYEPNIEPKFLEECRKLHDLKVLIDNQRPKSADK